MADTSAFPNLTLKKIPQAILNKCEWDHDDYSFSLNVLSDDATEPEDVKDLRGFQNLVGLNAEDDET
jgi:adenine-specific DNA-methyltransferase